MAEQERITERWTSCVRCGVRLRSRVATPICYDCRWDTFYLDRLGLSYPVPSKGVSS